MTAVLDAPATATPTALSEEMVRALYKFGSLADTLRDSLEKVLPAGGQDAAAYPWAVRQYEALRTHLQLALPSDVADDLNQWTAAVGDDEQVTTSQLYLATATLTSFIDMLLGQRAWMTGYQLRDKQLEQAQSTQTPDKLTALDTGRPTGQYL